MTQRHDIGATAAAIVALNAWDKCTETSLAFVPQILAEPVVALVIDKPEGPVVGRILFFRGFENFIHFRLMSQVPDYGVFMTPMDIPHEELVGCRNGTAELVSYRPGYVPKMFDDALKELYADTLWECYGLMMRLESRENLGLSYADSGSLFARIEGLDGKWHDGPLVTPDPNGVVWSESVVLDRRKCAKAAKLEQEAKTVWEADLVQVTDVHTREKDPRFLYIIAAVDKATGEKRLWNLESVGNGGLKGLWESVAERLLDAILAYGKMPGEIHVRAPRFQRFVRPLGMHAPFKLVQHGNLEVLQRVLESEIRKICGAKRSGTGRGTEGRV